MTIEVRRHRQVSPWNYAALDARQREIAERVRAGEPGRLLLSELAPVITIGRRTPGSDLLPLGAVDQYLTDRGGLATYHGPGQWVLFPVERLEVLTGDSRAVRRVVESLLEIALEVGRSYRPEAEIRWGAEMGVWSSKGKFAAVGVHVEQGVLLHGLSLNGFRTVESFQGLRPCGLDAPVDFLLEPCSLEGRESAFLDLGQALLKASLKKFQNFEENQTEGLTESLSIAISHSTFH